MDNLVFGFAHRYNIWNLQAKIVFLDICLYPIVLGNLVDSSA